MIEQVYQIILLVMWNIEPLQHTEVTLKYIDVLIKREDMLLEIEKFPERLPLLCLCLFPSDLP